MAPHCTPQPSTYKPFWCPPTAGKERGVMCAGMVTSGACDPAEEGASSANLTSLTTGVETSGTVSQALGGNLEMVTAGVWQCFLGGDEIGE